MVKLKKAGAPFKGMVRKFEVTVPVELLVKSTVPPGLKKPTSSPCSVPLLVINPAPCDCRPSTPNGALMTAPALMVRGRNPALTNATLVACVKFTVPLMFWVKAEVKFRTGSRPVMFNVVPAGKLNVLKAGIFTSGAVKLPPVIVPLAASVTVWVMPREV